ncbi:MAG: hypothetical protein GWP75_02780 [Planctomycetia bacterium]|jgi:translation elongation factor P/translation initiation factor 5A|nr:hypothetical protein [Planctomycetia bacterium]
MHRFTTGLFRTAALATLAIVATGCSYYKITDPTTDKAYYTEKYESKDGITFTDATTEKQVTIQNAEIEDITSSQFKAATQK